MQFVFLLIRKKSELHDPSCNLSFFLLIRSIDLDAIFIDLLIMHYTSSFFCLQVLLTRALLLALAKSIVSYVT